MSKLWGGRYQDVTDALMWDFNASINVDRRMAQADVLGSIAYAGAICDVGIITTEERDTLVAGLEAVEIEFAAGTFAYEPMDEDIHTAVERRLGELVGDVAGKLHTGRSRNDQVATDVRLFLMDAVDALAETLADTQAAIVEQAEANLSVIMPGYTHLQPAMPVRFSHWLMQFFWMLQRDRERLADLRKRVAVCPLGAAALAGNAYGVDRAALAQALGFDGITENSMDAVSDRDMILETLSWGAQVGLHLSRLAEDLILYCSREFSFIRLDERYTTGSSIMPQKRNPDSMELLRGKSGRLVGNLTSMMVTAKGIPSTYDKDLQEDKEPLFDTLDTLAMLLPITAGVVRTMTVNQEAMTASLDEAMLATDLADYLVKKGLPFRQAHHAVGQAVLLSEETGIGLAHLSLDQFRTCHALFGEDVVDVLSFEGSVETHTSAGGTARAALVAQIEKAKDVLI